MKPTRLAVLVLILAFSPGAPSVGQPVEPDLEGRMEVEDPESLEIPGVQVGDLSLRSAVITGELPASGGGPVVVLAGRRRVSWIDAASLEVIRERSYDQNQSIVISPNGRYIAVRTESRHRRTKTIVNRIHIEDRSGRRLWEMDDYMLGWFEPTNSGGLVVYPAPSPKEYPVERFQGEWDRKTAYVRHPLEMYDREGNLVGQGIDHEECRLVGKGVFTPDDRYLAFTFASIPEENRGAYAPEYEDRVCLVLYDMVEGEELWRRYFEGHYKPGWVGITPSAHRVVCFAGALEGGQDIDFRFFLLDREGKVVKETDFSPGHGYYMPYEVAVSPAGRFCGVPSRDNRVRLIDLADGREKWVWEVPQGLERPKCLAVTDAGRAVVKLTRRMRDTLRGQTTIHLLGSGGGEAARIPDIDIGAPGPVTDAALTGEGRRLVIAHHTGVSRYFVRSGEHPAGPEAEPE
jgi:hypothetical protein